MELTTLTLVCHELHDNPNDKDVGSIRSRRTIDCVTTVLEISADDTLVTL